MLTLRGKLLNGIDRTLALGLVALLLGSALAFGGSVWWGRTAVVGLVLAVALAWLGRVALAGPWRMIRSPIVPLGALGLVLGVVQLLPLPATVVGRISSRSLAVNAMGVIPEKALGDDPAVELPDPGGLRTPLSVDRPATLRWLVGATACLTLVWVVSHYVNRLSHARVIWGSVVAAFFVNVVLATVQIASGSAGLYGFINPGSGPAWAPTVDDALASPATTVLRRVGEFQPDRPALAAIRPGRPFLLGSLMGGPGRFSLWRASPCRWPWAWPSRRSRPEGLAKGCWPAPGFGAGQSGGLDARPAGGRAGPGGVAGWCWASVPFAVGIAVVGGPGSWSRDAGKQPWR